MRHLPTTTSTIAVTSLCFAGTAFAAPVPVDNPSFEAFDVGNGNLDSGGAGTEGASNWQMTGSNTWVGDRNGKTLSTTTDTTPDATDGEQFAILRIDSTTNLPTVTQELTTAHASGTTYTLTLDIGDRSNTVFQPVDVQLGTGTGVGNNLFSRTVVSAATPFNDSGANDGWETWVFTFSGGSGVVGQDLRIDIVGQLPTTGGGQALVDNLRLEAVPEPSSLALLGLGGLLIARRRRRNG